MIFKKSFGLNGIVPDDYKIATNHKKIESGYIPNIAYIPVLNGYGNPAKILVKIGDNVDEGQLIAQGDGEISSNIHASIPGKIVSFEKKYLYNGKLSDVIVIELEGEFKKTGRKYDLAPWTSLTKDYMLRKLKEYGILGLADNENNFIKYSMFTKKNITLIVNGTEIEPFLTSDYRLMVDRYEDIIEGISIIKNICEFQKIYIGISENKKDAILKIKNHINNKFDFKIIPLKVKYPQNDERLLIKSIFGKFIPINKMPIDYGYLILNISTIIAIKEAIIDDKPFIDNIITVSGSGINNPNNLKIKIGTLLSEVIDECGGLKPGAKKIIINGPMKGYSQINLDTPITKNTKAIIALTDEESKNYEKDSICINCGKCIKSCAFGLMPNVLNRYIKNNLIDKAVKTGLLYCTECGACSWICPSRIPLLQIFNNGKEFNKKIKGL